MKHEDARNLFAMLVLESDARGVAPPTLKAVQLLGSYSSLCGTWWDANCTHLPATGAGVTWHACGSVIGAVESDPTCGGCRQILRMRRSS